MSNDRLWAEARRLAARNRLANQALPPHCQLLTSVSKIQKKLEREKSARLMGVHTAPHAHTEGSAMNLEDLIAPLKWETTAQGVAESRTPTGGYYVVCRELSMQRPEGFLCATFRLTELDDPYAFEWREECASVEDGKAKCMAHWITVVRDILRADVVERLALITKVTATHDAKGWNPPASDDPPSGVIHDIKRRKP